MTINNIRECLFGPFPTIDLGDITLREMNEDDAEAYFNYMSRAEMAPFLTFDNMPASLEKALEEVKYWGSLFSNKRSFYWGIALKANNKLIGSVGFNVISPSHLKAEISYDLDYDYWGKGMMLKSAKAVLKYADFQLGLMRTQATVITENVRSINLLERCGFKREGYLEKFEVVEGVHKDYYMYGRVR